MKERIIKISDVGGLVIKLIINEKKWKIFIDSINGFELSRNVTLISVDRHDKKQFIPFAYDMEQKVLDGTHISENKLDISFDSSFLVNVNYEDKLYMTYHIYVHDLRYQYITDYEITSHKFIPSIDDELPGGWLTGLITIKKSFTRPVSNGDGTYHSLTSTGIFNYSYYDNGIIDFSKK